MSDANIVDKYKSAITETKILRDLKHSLINNICYYKQRESENSKVLILQNFFDGKTLENVLNWLIKTLDEKDKVEFCILLFLELKKIHELGYTHHDLHESNILENTAASPPITYIIDFGRASVKSKFIFSDIGQLQRVCRKLVPNQTRQRFRETRLDKEAINCFTDEVNVYIKMYQDKLESLMQLTKKPSAKLKQK